MKTGPVRYLVLIVSVSFGLAAHVMAGGFKSQVIDAAGHLDIAVPDGVFLKIRNFTQQGGTGRGVVTVTIEGQSTPAIVLAATIIETQSSTAPTGPTPTPALEPINSVIIAGPATVTIAAPSDVSAFVTYRKEKDSN